MKVAELLEQRRANWQELESLCAAIPKRGGALVADRLARFSALYRAAAADLALASAYQLPPATVRYLHQLVGKAHNQLYRARRVAWSRWIEALFVETPQRVFRDPCVLFALLLFWGVFVLSAWMAHDDTRFPQFADGMLGEAMKEQLDGSFREPLGGRPWSDSFGMASFYIYHNTGIGVRCFAMGLLIIPGLYTLLYNGAALGAAFGYMARPDNPGREHFYEFVTAHGPFELTAIVLSAGAGLRLGMSWLSTGGLSRADSMLKTGRETLPYIGVAAVMFGLAALLEGFVSPSDLYYGVKVTAAIVSGAAIMFYFVVLGFPRSAFRAV